MRGVGWCVSREPAPAATAGATELRHRKEVTRISGLGHRGTHDIAGHPDVAEMRARHERIAEGRPAVALDGVVLLLGR
jgi:hypothetical protein